MRVSVVSLNWNGRKILGRLLDEHIRSLLNTDYDDFEIIFADNGSTDDSVEYVRQHYRDPRLKIISLKRNYGYAMGNNLAFRATDPKSKIVVFINNDTIVDKHWLRELVKAFKDPNVGIAQPLLKNFDGSIQFMGGFVDIWGRSMTIGGNPQFNFMLTKLIKLYESRSISVLWVYGACLAVRKQLFQKIGGFNILFKYSLEEQSVSIPLTSLGFKAVIVPRSIVYHRSGATVSRVLNREMYANYVSNRILFIIIYFPTPIMLLSLSGRLILELLNATRNKQPWALINGVRRILTVLHKALRIRRSLPKVPDKYLIRTPLILDSSSHFLYALTKLLELNKLSIK